MKLLKLATVVAVTGVLFACGGGDNDNANNNNSTVNQKLDDAVQQINSKFELPYTGNDHGTKVEYEKAYYKGNTIILPVRTHIDFKQSYIDHAISSRKAKVCPAFKPLFDDGYGGKVVIQYDDKTVTVDVKRECDPRPLVKLDLNKPVEEQYRKITLNVPLLDGSTISEIKNYVLANAIENLKVEEIIDTFPQVASVKSLIWEVQQPLFECKEQYTQNIELLSNERASITVSCLSLAKKIIDGVNPYDKDFDIDKADFIKKVDNILHKEQFTAMKEYIEYFTK